MALSITQYRKHPSSKDVGYFLIISSAALYALTHAIGKPLLGTGEINFDIHPIALVATIYIINGLFFTPLAKKSTPIKSIGSKNLFLIAMIGVAELAGLATYFFGLKDSTAINASIFSNGEIIFALLIAIMVFKERLRRNELTPFFMIIFGMMVLPLVYDAYQSGMVLSNLVFGDLLIILSGLFFALDVNICKYVSDRISSKRITQLYSFFGGGAALVLLIAFQIPYDIDIEQLGPISFIAIAGTGLATVFFLIALRLIGAVRTILIYSTTSIFGIIFSAIILSEQITTFNVISIITVMSGIYLLRNRLGYENNYVKSPQHIEKIKKSYHTKTNENQDLHVDLFPWKVENKSFNKSQSPLKTQFPIRRLLYEDN